MQIYKKNIKKSHFLTCFYKKIGLPLDFLTFKVYICLNFNNMSIKIKKSDLRKGAFLEQNGEILKLIDRVENGYMTLIEEIVDSEHSNPMIYGKQRWLVDVEEKSPFSTKNYFRTHRDIIFEIGVYRKRRVAPVEEDGEIVYKETVKELDISVNERIVPNNNFIVDNFIKITINGKEISVF